METTIFLVRHGETVDNARQIMQGQTQGELNERGIDQARQVALRLAGEPLDAVVASDLRRAVQTAEFIAARHGLPVTTTPLLRERDWGGFTGRFIPELKHEPWPDDIETEEALLERARQFLLQMTATYPGKRVVAVGHGIVNKAILAVFAQCPMALWPPPPPLKEPLLRLPPNDPPLRLPLNDPPLRLPPLKEPLLRLPPNELPLRLPPLKDPLLWLPLNEMPPL